MPPELDYTRHYTKKFGAPWHVLLAATLRRATTLEWKRNWPAAVVRWLLAALISIIAGSIFWQLPATFEGASGVAGVLFWVLCFLLVLTVPTVEATYLRRPVLWRQRRNHFYAGWMDAVPQVGRCAALKKRIRQGSKKGRGALQRLAPPPGRRAPSLRARHRCRALDCCRVARALRSPAQVFLPPSSWPLLNTPPHPHPSPARSW